MRPEARHRGRLGPRHPDREPLKRVEVTAACGSEEGIDNLSRAGEIDVGSLGRRLHSAARPAREARGARSNHPACSRHGKC
jgi:hypothetical protein